MKHNVGDVFKFRKRVQCWPSSWCPGLEVWEQRAGGVPALVIEPFVPSALGVWGPRRTAATEALGFTENCRVVIED